MDKLWRIADAERKVIGGINRSSVRRQLPETALYCLTAFQGISGRQDVDWIVHSFPGTGHGRCVGRG